VYPCGGLELFVVDENSGAIVGLGGGGLELFVRPGSREARR